MRRALVAVAVVAVVVGAIALAGGFGSARSGTSSAKAAPPLPRERLSGPPTTLASLRGRPAVVNFWASWCAPCRREAPAFQRFSEQLGGRARLVGVDWNDARGGAKAFIRHYRWTFSTLRDASGTAGNAYGIRGLPTTFIVDARGSIVRRLEGPQSVASIDRALRAAAGP